MTTANGRFYIDNITHDFYLRENDAWHLKGNIGPNGSAGFGPPSESPAPEGLYIDLENGDVYIDGGLVGQLPGGSGVGPPGNDGRPGFSIPGTDGEDGDSWPIPGRAGADGCDGLFIPGQDGEDGDSWPIPGRPGTDGEDGASITGPAGADGLSIPGQDGDDGDSWPLPGTRGIDGRNAHTIPGLDGDDGDSWPVPGRPGIDGLTAIGLPGFDGEDGDPAPIVPGKDGRPGGQHYVFNSSTLTNTDPGDGKFTLNNTPSGVAWTVMSISRKNADGITIALLLQAAMNSGTECIITFKSGDGSKIIQAIVLANSLVDNTTYYTLTVSALAGSGSMGNGLDMYLDMERSGTDAGFRFTFSTNTASTDPGAGKFQVNNVTFGSATTVSFSNTDGRGVNVRAALRRLMNTGTQCLAQGFTRDGARQYPFLVLVTGFVDNTTYDTYGIQPLTGAVPTNNDVVFFTFSKFGDQGLQGASIGVPGRDGEDADPWPTPFALNTVVVRIVLGANLTYYVRSDGSDSNSGLVNTAAGAFLTAQRAMDVIATTLDVNGYTVTVQLQDNTWTAGVNIKTWVGGGVIHFLGNTTTMANNKITVTGGNVFDASFGVIPGIVRVSGFQIKTITSGFGLVSRSPGRFQFTKIAFDTMPAAHIVVTGSGLIEPYGDYSIIGGTAFHALTGAGGTVNWTALDLPSAIGTITLTGTPAFTQFVRAQEVSRIVLNGGTFSGSASAGTSRYNVQSCSAIVRGADDLPGGTAGTTSSGGEYV